MLNYSYNVTWSDEDQMYVATSAEFPDSSALASTADEAIRELKDALEGVIAVMQEEGAPLPPPHTVSPYSGQFRLRIPKSIHAQLAQMAEMQGISLNSLALAYISEALGTDRAMLQVARRFETAMARAEQGMVSDALRASPLQVTEQSGIAIISAPTTGANVPMNVFSQGGNTNA